MNTKDNQLTAKGYLPKTMIGYMDIVRTCKKCNKSKDKRAFIGDRAICRICWKDLSESEKKDNFSYVNYAGLVKEKKEASVRCDSPCFR